MSVSLFTSSTYNTNNAYNNVRQNSNDNASSSASIFVASSAPVETAGSVA